MLSEPDPPCTPEQVAELFNLVHRELIGHSMDTLLQFLQRAELSMPRLVALVQIQRHQVATISSLSKHLNLSPGTVSQMIDQLVQDGLVERHEAARDRRQKLISLTPAGETLVAEIRQIQVNEVSHHFRQLPPELLEQLGRVLRAVCREWQLVGAKD
ncbi:MAG: MarR family transcriptional regulator [Chloroflexus sp.]